MVEGTNASLPRWWQDARWITALVGFVVVVSLLWGLFGPEPAIVVSRETTFITEPLFPDGLPDYRAFAAGDMGRGTPASDNAAVAVLEATWPMELDAMQLAHVCRELGIPETPPEFAPLVWADADEELRRTVGELLGPVPPPGPPEFDPARQRRGEVDQVISRSQVGPWTAAECPPLGDWVARSSPALDVLRAGAARPRYAMPLLDPANTGPLEPLILATTTDIQTLRNVARALAARAMLHLGEGRPREAWRDIHAVHRLARLLAPADRGGFMIAHLVSVAIGATANGLTVELLQAPDLAAEDVATIRRDLEALPPRADAGAALRMERIAALDVVMLLPRARREEWAVMTDTPVPFRGTSLDLNVVLRELNAFYDRIDAAARLSDRAERTRRLLEIEAGLIDQARVAGPWQAAAWGLRMAMNRSARSVAVATQLAGLLGPAVESFLAATDRARVEFDLLRVAAALADYRVRGLGGPDRPYPDALDALVPEVLVEVPGDPFCGAPLVYERRGAGYLLYAVGTNGIDDGGTSGDVVKGEWQPEDPSREFGLDNVIRVPTPHRPLLPGR